MTSASAVLNSSDISPIKEWLAPRAQVVSHLRDWISNGTLSHGQQLPSERTLAQQLGVSRETVRSALEILGDEGLIRSNGGRLRHVHAPQENGVGQGAQRLLQNSIAVLTRHEMPFESHRQHGWYEYLGQGAEVAIRGAGLNALTLHPDSVTELEIEHLAQAAPRGVLVVDTIGDLEDAVAVARTLQERGLRVAVLGDGSQLAQFDRVASDHESGAYALTRWMIEQGRKRILNLWGASARGSWLDERERGYRRAMNEAGLEPLGIARMEPISRQEDAESFALGARRTAGTLVEHLVGESGVDALLLLTDRDAFYAAAACRLFGREPGRDVLIGGYDNYWRDCAERQFESSVPAATIDKWNDRIGAEAVRLLLERVAGTLPDEPQLRRIEPQLIDVGASKKNTRSL
jgi:DNA-binding LacI/PurR family transcriptional regulator